MDVKVVPASMDEYKALLAADFPELKVNSIRYLGSGWDNAAILVNETYVFRFPRGLFDKSERIKTDEIEKEALVLKFLHGKVSFEVPKPDYVADGYRYFGYKLINGTLWDQLPEDQQFTDELLKSWVETRSELSEAISPEEADKLKVPRYRTDKNQSLVNDYLNHPTGDERVKKLAKEAMDYVCGQLAENGRWVLLHEDLQQSNCFIDPAAGKISGVIDFFDSEIGPVEADFYFWSKWGRPMLEKMAQLQEEYDDTKIDVRLAEAMHQFYAVADYVDFTRRGFSQSAQHKWQQIEAYL